MNSKNIILTLFNIILLSACANPQHIEVAQPQLVTTALVPVQFTVPSDFSSATQIQPDRIFSETPESRTVIVGSQLQASINGCSNMQRYRIRANTDFLSTLNLFKYRAALMGAKRIVIINHTEIGSNEFVGTTDRTDVFARQGTTLRESAIFTSLTADLYDCGK
jgi:hypothetical protein